MSLVPDVSPKTFSFSAVVVGYLLLDDLTAREQNALGNWLMLVAQVICTNGFYKQVQSERKIKVATGISDVDETITLLKKMVEKINIEIGNLNNR